MFTSVGGVYASLVAGAPQHLAPVVHKALWPELTSQVQAIVRNPRKIRAVRVGALEDVVKELERAAGVATVVAALGADRRVAAQRLLRNYGECIDIPDTPPGSSTAAGIHTVLRQVAAPHLSSTIRDIVRRVDPHVVGDLLDYAHACSTEEWSLRSLRRSIFGEVAGMIASGEVIVDSMSGDSALLIMQTLPETILTLPVSSVIEGFSQAGGVQDVHGPYTVVWNMPRHDLLFAWRDVWRSNGGGAVRCVVAALLAVHDYLHLDDIPAASRDLGSLAGTTLSRIAPGRREAYLQELPEGERLHDTAHGLATSGDMSVWALCDLVRRSESTDVGRWLRQGATGTTLAGGRGRAVAQTIIAHWDAVDVKQLLSYLRERTFLDYREELEYFALHAPGGRDTLGDGGTLGDMARRCVYETLGDDSRLWDNFRILLPTWRGSVVQLTTAVARLSQDR